ncbi:YtzI protein [Virgibacillus flavescens]|uniref:YtzI protein n=1 Tax=Virgibacillus flavescens TaxID=1611422 RepID=UPI003D331E07
MTGYIILAIAIILFVLVLSLITINKGYAFKHSIDELPEENQNDDEQEKSDNKNHHE